MHERFQEIVDLQKNYDTDITSIELTMCIPLILLYNFFLFLKGAKKVFLIHLYIGIRLCDQISEISFIK